MALDLKYQHQGVKASEPEPPGFCTKITCLPISKARRDGALRDPRLVSAKCPPSFFQKLHSLVIRKRELTFGGFSVCPLINSCPFTTRIAGTSPHLLVEPMFVFSGKAWQIMRF